MRTTVLSPYLALFAAYAITFDASCAEPAFRIEQSVVITSPPDLHFAQSRAALIPGTPPRVILTTQQIEKKGAHGYRDVFVLETTDNGKTWSPPQSIDSLKRKAMPEGYDFVIGDVCPQWHAKTQTVLVNGKTFGFRGGVKEDRSLERVSYATYSPAKNEWSGLNILTMPDKYHEGKTMLESNAGCHQRVDLPNGDVLLPVRYRKDPKTRQYTTVVARCTYDGETLKYVEHGTEMTIPRQRGLYEPSIASFGGRYFVTMRADHSAFVARSTDGLNYEPFVEWTFDDGQVLGSYNAQQHWITHNDALYLTYTRRGANNDHVFRSRAPLFIARVDPEKLRVIRATETILMPEEGADLAGGFAPVAVSPTETWVISSEMALPKARSSGPNRILMARIVWAAPDQNFPSSR